MDPQNPRFPWFAEFLARRQAFHDETFDIRAHILSLRDRPVTLGFTQQALATAYPANTQELFSDQRSFENEDAAESDTFFASGTIFRDEEISHKGFMRLLETMPSGKDPILMEQGFLGSTHSWAHAFRNRDRNAACLGYVYDDIAHYFMADYPNRLIQRLNSDDSPSPAELARARALIDRIVARRISKYNAQPFEPPDLPQTGRRRVLIADQAYADASTVYGKVDDSDFEQMLVAALRENPDADIIIKTHPDTSWEKEKRTGYYNDLAATGRVHILRDPVNPFVMFDLVDKVYVGTSQLGLEALFAGKEVVCFGAPFYAGWGLTDDRKPLRHRHRGRSLEEIFHYFYIWYTIYHIPGFRAPCEIERVLDYIEAGRPFFEPAVPAEWEAPPKVSVIIPIHGVEAYVEQCLTSIQRQTLREIEIIPVNDCSPDNSQAIIDRLAATDKRIRPLVLTENVGQGFARNKGIEVARGDYIWFIDGDDWFMNADALRQVYESAQSNGGDMVRGRKAYEAVFNSSGSLVSHREDKTERNFERAIENTTYADAPMLLHNRHFWTWLYRRDFLNENAIRFATPQWEERAFLVKALVAAKTISATTTDAVAYRVRADSTARRSRTPADMVLLRRNFDETFESLTRAGAADPGHPLHRHLFWHLSQFVSHMLTSQHAKAVRKAGHEAWREHLDYVRATFERFDFGPGDFIPESHLPNTPYRRNNAFPLLISAIRTGRTDLLEAAADLAPISRETLFAAFLSPSDDPAQLTLRASLNRYGRNTKVSRRRLTRAPARKPRIVVHIGATKTGSTYLQHMLEVNRPDLLKAGIWYPEVGLFWQPNRQHKQAGHADFSAAASNRKKNLRRHIEDGLARMDGKVHTVLLSSEAYFLQSDAQAIAGYFKGYPVEMVVYLRRQDEWANAQYCEFVAGGAVSRVDVPLEDWLADETTTQRLDYRNPLNKWEQAVGAENIRVRIFEPGRLKDGDLVADFAEATGLPQLLDLPRGDESDRNAASLSGAHVELIRGFNTRPFPDRNAYFAFIEQVTQELAAFRAEQGLPMPKPWVMTQAQAAQVMTDAEAGNREIARRFFDSTDTLFAPGRPPPEPIELDPREVEIVEQAYELNARPHSIPMAYSRPKRIVNYGLFGWRRWALAPLIRATAMRRSGETRRAQFRDSPFDYAHHHWSARHPRLVRLGFPEGNVYGPFGMLRFWSWALLPLMRKAGLRKFPGRFKQDPILAMRTARRRYRRWLGRLIFPLGEVEFSHGGDRGATS